jgi:hypothetical protein
MRPIRARSRSSVCVETSMLSSSSRASAGSSTGVCPDVTTYPGPRTVCAGFDRHDLAVYQPIEQVAQCCEPLFDRGRSQLAR